MHELGITRNIVSIVAEHAGTRRVTKVTVSFGKLAAVMPDAVAFCFDMCTKGTALDGATLEILESDSMASCRACETRFAMQTLFDKCPKCGSNNLERPTGDDLVIKQFEFESDVSETKEAV